MEFKTSAATAFVGQERDPNEYLDYILLDVSFYIHRSCRRAGVHVQSKPKQQRSAYTFRLCFVRRRGFLASLPYLSGRLFFSLQYSERLPGTMLRSARAYEHDDRRG